MTTFESILISPDTPLREAISKIDAAATQMALVVDPERRLLGTLTDGDIRRAILAEIRLDEPVHRCMFRSPTTAKTGEPRQAILAKMRQRLLHQIPVLDDSGRVVDLKTIDEFLSVEPRSNWVVIMAGGLGTRMKELTRDTPKPMLKVGDRPLLETIVSRFVEQGFTSIWLAVNYHADKIEQHFGDGTGFGARIRYLRENKRLGTAGALSLLPETPQLPVLVTNADLLVAVDYADMIDAHRTLASVATMGVREYEYQIPYGVVRTSVDRIEEIEEKPVRNALVNAGIYVLSPSAVSGVPADTFFDMPELFNALMRAGQPVHYFRINGYWLDIGRHEDLHKANSDFSNVFLG